MANLEMRQIATYLGIHISYITYSITLKKFISGSMCAGYKYVIGNILKFFDMTENLKKN